MFRTRAAEDVVVVVGIRCTLEKRMHRPACGVDRESLVAEMRNIVGGFVVNVE